MAAALRPLVLIVEDEQDLVTLLRYNLEKQGYDVLAAGDGEEGLALARERGPAVMLLDWMLPGMSGLDLCRQLRRDQATEALPIVMLTAKTVESDRVRGLDTGADDYVPKPFSPNELIARMRAVMRRAAPGHTRESLTFSDIEMDVASHRVYRGDRPLHLGPTEFRLLQHFLQNPGRVFSREQLLDVVWGQDVYVETRTVDVHIRRLRKALNAGGEGDVIRTVRSAGYALDECG